MSPFFHLASSDFLKAGVVFVLASVFTFLAQQFNAPGFDFATFRWDELFKVAGMATMAYLSKNLLSTEGKFMGRL